MGQAQARTTAETIGREAGLGVQSRISGKQRRPRLTARPASRSRLIADDLRRGVGAIPSCGRKPNSSMATSATAGAPSAGMSSQRKSSTSAKRPTNGRSSISLARMRRRKLNMASMKARVCWIPEIREVCDEIGERVAAENWDFADGVAASVESGGRQNVEIDPLATCSQRVGIRFSLNLTNRVLWCGMNLLPLARERSA